MSTEPVPPAGRHRGRSASRPGRAASVALSAKVLASLLSAVLLLAIGYAWYNYSSLDRGLHKFTLSHLAGGSADKGSAGGASASAGPHVDGTAQNILIVGIDSRDDLSAAQRKTLHVGSDTSLSTDSMMVIHVPADGSKATMISLPRDSYVDITGYRKNKLNAAYADAYSDASGTEKHKEAAGADLLVETVSQLTGLSINHYVQVSFGGFYTITKAIGKIPVDICHDTDDSKYSGFVMTAGHHDLTPVQALEFVRQRHNLAGGDLGRADRQRYFLTAAFAKIASAGVLLNPVKLHNLIGAITGSFYVDDKLTIQSLAAQMSNLSAKHIIGQTIPTEGGQMVNGQDVEIVDPAKVQTYVAELLNGTLPAPKSSGPSTHSSAPVDAPSGSSTKSADAGCVN